MALESRVTKNAGKGSDVSAVAPTQSVNVQLPDSHPFSLTTITIMTSRLQRLLLDACHDSHGLAHISKFVLSIFSGVQNN